MALLDHDWNKVFDTCQKDDSLLKKPETIGVLAHAAIMLNKDNLSYLFFIALDADSNKKKAWQNWTYKFAEKYPNHAVAYYLQGDASMRNGDEKKALECFNKAISIDPKFAPAYNSRGVLYTIENDKSHAVSDFNTACSLAPTIAGFFVNRGTMFYNYKAPEAAANDFAKALSVSRYDAFALNGKACSKLFDFREISNRNLFDSVAYYLYDASARLNLRVFNQNKHSLIMQVEDRIYPDMKETPFFRVSDFLDWNSLHQLSLTHKYDLFRTLLGDTLPANINAQTLVKLNTILAKANIFKNCLQDKNVPDSLKMIINQVQKADTSLGQCLECRNRLVFERIYAGLIMPYKKRDPGMNVSTQVNLFDAGYASHYWSQPQNILHDLNLNFHGEIKIPGASMGFEMSGKADRWALAATQVTDAVQSTFRNRTSAYNMDQNTLRQLSANPRISSTTRENLMQGGAIANIRRQYTDNDSPYFLICLNGLGYAGK